MMDPCFLVRFDIIWFKFTSTTLYHIFIYKANGVTECPFYGVRRGSHPPNAPGTDSKTGRNSVTATTSYVTNLCYNKLKSQLAYHYST
jgi:hypothetical protein